MIADTQVLARLSKILSPGEIPGVVNRLIRAPLTWKYLHRPAVLAATNLVTPANLSPSRLAFHAAGFPVDNLEAVLSENSDETDWGKILTGQNSPQSIEEAAQFALHILRSTGQDGWEEETTNVVLNCPGTWKEPLMIAWPHLPDGHRLSETLAGSRSSTAIAILCDCLLANSPVGNAAGTITAFPQSLLADTLRLLEDRGEKDLLEAVLGIMADGAYEKGGDKETAGITRMAVSHAAGELLSMSWSDPDTDLETGFQNLSNLQARIADQLADEAHRSGKTSIEIERRRQALQAEPTALRRALLAQSLNAEGKFSEALDAISTACESVEECTAAGIAQLSLGQQDRAALLLSQAVEHLQDINGNLTSWFSSLLDALHTLGSRKLSLEAAEKYSKLVPGNAQANTYYAQELLAAGDPGSAIDAAQIGLALAPGLLPARQALAMAYEAAGQWNQALPHWEALCTEDESARHRLAACALREGSLDTARSTAEAMLSDSPENMQAHALMAHVQSASGEHEKALANLRALLDTHPQSPLLWQSLFDIQENTAADDELESILSRAIQAAVDSPMLLNTYASWLQERGRISEAVGFAERSFRLNQNSPDTAALYARLLLKTADPKAEVVLQKAHELQPRSAGILLDLAELAEEQGQHERAGNLLSRLSIGLKPVQNLNAGRILFRARLSGDTLPAAIRHLERAAGHEDTSLLASFWLARSLAASGDIQEAIQQYRSFLANPRCAGEKELRKEAFLRLAEAAVDADDTILSLTTLENARDIFSDDCDVLLPLSRAYLAAGLYQQSMDTCLHILALEENKVEARRLLLQASIEAGSLEMAEDYLQAMIDCYPEDPRTWLGAASLRLTQEDTPGLRNAIAAALFYGRQNPEVLIDAAEIMLAAGLRGSAARVLRYGINTLPIEDDLLRKLAEISEHTEDFQAAQKAWRLYTQQAPQDPEGFLNAIQSLWKLGRRAAAFELLHQAASRFPDTAAFPLLLARYQLAQDMLSEARISLRKALDTASDDPSTLMEAASGFIQLNALSDAEALLNRAISMGARSAKAHVLLAECLVLQGEMQKANQQLEKYSPQELNNGSGSAWWLAVKAFSAAKVKAYSTAHEAFSLAHARELHSEKDRIWLSRAARALGYDEIGLQVFRNLPDFSALSRSLRDELMEAWIHAAEADAVLRDFLSIREHAVSENAFRIPALQGLQDNYSHAMGSNTNADPQYVRLKLANMDLTKDLLESIETPVVPEQDRGMLTSLAVFNIRQQRPGQALDLLRRVHQTGTLDDWHHVLIAASLVQKNQTELARKTINGIRSNPYQQPLLDYIEAQTWLLEDNPERFCESVSKAVSTWDSEPVWQFELGRTYAMLNDTAAAVAHLQQAVRLDTQYMDAHQLLAYTLEKDGQIAEALQAFEKAVQINPAEPGLMVQAGCLALQLDQPQKSAQWFERAGSLGADSEAYHLGLARTLSTLGDHTRAAEAVQAVIRKFPENTDALLLLSEIHRKEGKADQALQALEKAAESMPESNSLAVERARLLIETGQHEKALELLEPLSDLNPEDEDLWSLISLAHSAGKDLNKAMQAMTRAARLAPRNHSFRTELGILAFELGQLDRALDELDTAAELNPESSSIHMLRGDIFEARRQYTRALEAYQKAIQLDPDQSESHFKAGLILKQMKAYPEAGMMLKQAASLNSQDPDIMHQLAAVRALELVHGKSLQPAVES